MKVLRMLLKHPQLLRLTGYEDGKPLTAETRAEALKLIKQAHIFLIDSGVAEQANSFGPDLGYIPMSPPFPVCWFEVHSSRTPGMLPLMFMDTRDFGHDRSIVLAELGILVHEKAPCLYDLFCFEAVKPKHEGDRMSTLVSVFRNVTDGAEDLTGGIAPITVTLRYWMNALRSGALGVEETPEVVHVPRADRVTKTKPHPIRRLIRIVPKASRAQIAPSTAQGRIDWSHRWEVRGHWRKVDGIGKDREGEYLVEGFTWVRQYVKGPETLPVIGKTRVVVGGRAGGES